MEPTNTPPPAAPAGDDATPQVDSYGFPIAGDMSTDSMADAELEAFVDQTLGVKPSKGATSGQANPATPAPAEPTTPPTPPSPASPAEPKPADPPTNPPAATPEEPAKPVEVPTLDTSDLWVEVTDTKGEKVRLTLDDGVPDGFLFATDKQLYEVLDAFQEMKQIRKDRQADITKAQADKTAADTAAKSQQETFANWANEIQDLIDAGLIAKTDAPPADGKQYSQAEIDASEGLKLTNQVFDYMKTENAKRQIAGKAPLTSFAAAYTLYTKTSEAAAEAQRLQETNAIAKQRGAMVGGTSAPAGSDKPYVYKRGSARNIFQVDTSDI